MHVLLQFFLLSPKVDRPGLSIWTNLCYFIFHHKTISSWFQMWWATLNPLYPMMLCAQWFWRRRFLKIVNVISQLSPLGKGRGPSIEQTWIPFTQECFVPSLVEIGPVVLEKKMKMWKVYDNDDGQRTNFDQKSSHELSASVFGTCSVHLNQI